MARRSSDLALATAIAGAAALSTLLGVSNPALRIALALPLGLVLPGYAITAAALPRYTLGLAERLLFSIGVSLAVTALGGLVLNWTPWGLQAGLWVLWLFSLTLGASAIAMVRRRRGAEVATEARGVGLNLRQGLLLGLAALVVVAAIGVARVPAPQQGLQGYSMLWIWPRSLTDQRTVRLGVSCMEFKPTTYRLQLEVNGRIVEEWPSIALDPGQTWEDRVELSTEQIETGQVEASLYRQDAPAQVYRHVVWQLQN